MLDTWLIEAENAYRNPLSIKEEKNFMVDESLIDRENWEEHYVRKGDPKKPTYYIIRHKSPNTGIFANFGLSAGHIVYALSNGWIPVIDMQNYLNSLTLPKELGKENTWEYFFEQPLRIGLEQAYNGENIILSSGIIMVSNFFRIRITSNGVYKGWVKFPDACISYLYDNKSMEMIEWRMLVKMGLLKIKPEIMEEIMAIRAKLFAPTDRVLGVYLRGTDYVAIKPKNHPIPPPVEYARDVILEKIRAWNCNKIFLSTEDKNIVQFFKDTFGDGFGTFCVTIDREYVDYKPGHLINSVHVNRENDRFLNAKEYLTEMVILSKCNSIITSRCSGSMGAMILSEGFENLYAFNLGNYGVKYVDWKKLIGQ